MKRYISILVIAACIVAGVVIGWFGRGFAASSALPGTEEDPLVSKSYVDARTKLQVVDLPQGKSLIGFAGTEIILRSGTATVIDSSLGGLCDVTGGIDLRKGWEVPANHLLIIPRDDGRGVKATVNAILMVRGKYEIR